MKKRWSIPIPAIAAAVLAVFAAGYLLAAKTCASDTPNSESILAMYREFLSGEREAEARGIDGRLRVDEIFRFDTQNERECNKYALFDMNGDGVPELHIRSAGPYEIITYRDGELIEWASFWSYSHPLNNGAVLNCRADGGNDRVYYGYSVFDFYGNEQLVVWFEKYNANKKGEYDETSLYIFGGETGGIDVTKEVWEKLAEKYLSVGDDLIEWCVYEKENLAF